MQAGRCGGAGADGVDGDAVLDPLQGQNPGQIGYARLTGAVGGPVFPCYHRQLGRDVDDSPISLVDHGPGGGLGAKKRAFQVSVHHGVPVFFGDLQSRLPAADAGVVHQDIQPPEVPNHRCDGLPDVCQVQHVQRVGGAFPVRSFDLRLDSSSFI